MIHLMLAIRLLCLCVGVILSVLGYYYELPGVTYGLVDQGILLLGAYTGLEIDPFITKRFKNARPGLGVLLGAGVGNTVSDFLGAVAEPALHPAIIGITLGCIIPFFVIPIIESLVTRNKGVK